MSLGGQNGATSGFDLHTNARLFGSGVAVKALDGLNNVIVKSVSI